MPERHTVYPTDVYVDIPSDIEFEAVTIPTGPESEYLQATTLKNGVIVPEGASVQITAGIETIKIHVWSKGTGRTFGATVQLGPNSLNLYPKPKQKGLHPKNRTFSPEGIEIIYGEEMIINS